MKLHMFVPTTFLTLTLLMESVHAAAQVEIIKYEAGSSDYLTYIFHSWDPGSNIPLDPTYCPEAGCAVGIAWQVGDPSGNGYIAPPNLYPYETKGARTVGDLERLWRQKFGYGATVRKSGAPIRAGDREICFGMKYGAATNKGVRVVPGSSCVDLVPGPPVNACYMDGPIVLDHGSVPENRLSDSTISQNINVRCLERSLVLVSLITGNGDGDIKLNPQGSLISTVSVNGKTGSSGDVVSVPGGAGGVNVEFKSTLKTNGTVGGGVFSGSATALLSVL